MKKTILVILTLGIFALPGYAQAPQYILIDTTMADRAEIEAPSIKDSAGVRVAIVRLTFVSPQTFKAPLIGVKTLRLLFHVDCANKRAKNMGSHAYDNAGLKIAMMRDADTEWNAMNGDARERLTVQKVCAISL